MAKRADSLAAVYVVMSGHIVVPGHTDLCGRTAQQGPLAVTNPALVSDVDPQRDCKSPWRLEGFDLERFAGAS